MDIPRTERICLECSRSIPHSVSYCPQCGSAQSPNMARPAGEHDRRVGTVLDNRFRILDRVGSGGMAVVYRAEQISNRQTVALKVLKSLHGEDPTLIKRFHREAALASRLSHPNTVGVHHFGGTLDGTLYLAMEYVNGVSLKAELKRTKIIPWKRACKIAIQVAKSLQNAHENNIIHRDLKPDNIMLTRKEQGGDFVKVLDFGIATIISPTTEGDEKMLITAPNEVFGTPDYMSPEQIAGNELDCRTDIYSLGIVMYHMLTGAPPFEARRTVQLMQCHLHNTPRRFYEVDPSSHPVPLQLESLVMFMLRKKPEERPSSMQTIIDRLDRIQYLKFKKPALAPSSTSETQRNNLPNIGNRRKARQLVMASSRRKNPLLGKVLETAPWRVHHS